jgi:hypothetical protein
MGRAVGKNRGGGGRSEEATKYRSNDEKKEEERREKDNAETQRTQRSAEKRWKVFES